MNTAGAIQQSQQRQQRTETLKEDILRSNPMHDWKNCPAYLLTGEHFNTIIEKIKSLEEVSNIKDDMLQKHLEKQDSFIEGQNKILQKMVNKIDDNKKSTDKKIDGIVSKTNIFMLKVAGAIISSLIGLVVLLIVKLPDIIEWIKIMVNSGQ
ncbi:hypothetical protein DRQ25_08910 [Candidatus Fermentibacteria bacterium]|nr:MAG: hypothetical protein DRQ25_08910 [Candidatus Fermentibacteria bacterium]